MQRVQKIGLLAAAMVLTACGPSDLGRPLTVGGYVKDYDLMQRVIAKRRSNPAAYDNDPAFINAKAAYVLVHEFRGFRDCWKKGVPKSTATADQGCIDRKLKESNRE